PARAALEVELLELLHAVEAARNGLEVGEPPAQPALVHVRLVHAIRLLGNRFLRLLLRTDEEARPTPRDGLLDEVVGLVDVVQGLLQVDDVDAGALGEDEALHLRVPAAGLMPEMHAAVEQLTNGDDGHGRSPVLRTGSRAIEVIFRGRMPR